MAFFLGWSAQVKFSGATVANNRKQNGARRPHYAGVIQTGHPPCWLDDTKDTLPLSISAIFCRGDLFSTVGKRMKVLINTFGTRGDIQPFNSLSITNEMMATPK
jgi:hypothetical protein